MRIASILFGLQPLIILINAISKLAYESADKQITHIDSPDFENEVLKGGKWFCFFGANWCHHCQDATPEWQKLEKDFSNLLESKYDIRMRKIECTTELNTDLCKKLVTDGFPSLVFFNEGKEYKRQDVIVDSAVYDGFKNFLGKMIAELDSRQIDWIADQKDTGSALLEKSMQHLKDLASKTFGKDPTTNPDGKIVILTDKDFSKRVNLSSWFVMFHAPW